ncbi:MAG: GMC family oxidoreductase N-terminal domain-containing protein [Actinomycetota bacterium]
MRTAIVVGSGAGGATVAKELQGAYDVTVLEAGRPYRRCELDRRSIDRLARSRLLVDPRLIRLAYPPMRVRRTDDMLVVHGSGTGGTTTVATGNGIRADDDLRALGIDLDEEFAQIASEIPVSVEHRRRWHPTTRRLFAGAEDLGLAPQPTPKMGNAGGCRHCGRCVLGCPHGIKWDARRFLDVAVAHGARVHTGMRVDRVVTESGRVVGVVAGRSMNRRSLTADLVVLAAGGFGTPAILERSGIRCEPTLTVDPVLTVAARVPSAWQCNEIEMPFVVRRDRHILSPYFDWLSFALDPRWRHPPQDIVGVMVKLADEGGGRVEDRRVRTHLTPVDRSRLEEGAALARDLMAGAGIDPASTFEGILNGGHPGGTLPLTPATATTLHDERLPENLYVADATLFPRSLGLPPILTIVALATRVARVASSARSPVSTRESAGIGVGLTG